MPEYNGKNGVTLRYAENPNLEVAGSDVTACTQSVFTN